ncbi:olfactory receptor 6N2-like [Notolabrus celidotus]|uniref:olfactory receptor 6N2-like n=1 Tax=Notolabrus celidotus TaxID=1203425 RepID=UPI00148F5ACC|nr:olfactory receptor 6N2-like [Notolabrus celidotus]
MDEFNQTFISLGGYGEIDKIKHECFVLFYIVFMLIICSNSTIVCLIVKHQSLHEPMYIFIAALLINSVLFSTIIYPKLLIDLLSEKKTVLYSACLFQGVIYYIVAYSEFLLLSAMAYDRYVSICKPLQYATIMKKTTVSVLLFLAWFVPTCEITGAVAMNYNLELCSYTLKGIFCNNSLYQLFCVRSEALSVYGMVLLFNLGLLPVLLILFSYGRILLISYHSCREVRIKAAQTCLPHLMVLINFSCFFTFDVSIVRLESDIPQTTRLIMTLQVVLYHPLVNPFIYGIKMKDIYKHLKKLFC